MSLIHEALEKLEQEKKWKKAPAPLQSSPKENPRPRILYLISGLLTLLFALGGVYLFTHPLKVESQSKPEPRPSSLPAKIQSGSLYTTSPQLPFTLTGVTKMGPEWTAIINNQLVRVGDSVSGAKVEDIQHEGVLLNFRGRPMMLSLYEERSTHYTRIELARK